MMRKTSRIKIQPGAILLSAVLLVSPAVMAAAKVVPLEGVAYTVDASLADNLAALSGKRVTVSVDGGKSLTGVVKAVGQHLVHLEKIERKEFFDALIRIEDISAIETRFREYQR